MDDLLNQVDYTFKDYVPSQEALMFVNFIKEVNGGEEENKTPLIHLAMLDSVFSEERRNAIMSFRGSGKSSILAEYLILFIGAFGYLPKFGDVKFALYVSDSIENGVKSLRKNIEFRYSNSAFLQKLIPNKSLKVGTNDRGYVGLDEYDKDSGGRNFTDIRLEFENIKGHRFVVRGFGVKTGIRGAKELGSRPQLAICDDLLSDEDARSETVIESIENIIYKAISKALHPQKQKIIWLGTPFNAKDPLYKAIDSGAWSSKVFPICERFPVEKKEFRGAWEDRFNYDYIHSEHLEATLLGRPENFYQELMLRVMNTEERLVSDSDIIYFDRKFVYENRRNFNFYITTDIATSEKTSADYSVITIFAVNNNKDYLIVDGFCDKVEVSKFVNELFRYVAIFRPLGVGIEISGQQKGFVSWLRTEMIRRNIYFNFLSSNNNGEDGIRPIGDKFSRFNLFVPRFRQKKVHIANELKNSSWYKEFSDEISKASKKGFKSKHDDVLDTLSMIASFDVYAPSVEISKEESIFYDDKIETIRNTIF